MDVFVLIHAGTLGLCNQKRLEQITWRDWVVPDTTDDKYEHIFGYF